MTARDPEYRCRANPGPHQSVLHFKTRHLVTILGAVVTVLLLAHVLGVVLKFGLDRPFVFGFAPLVDFDREGNLPTFYASLALVFAGTLCAMIARWTYLSPSGRDWRYWTGLALLLSFAGLDEAICIHEQLIRPVRQALGTSGIFYFAWVIPYGIATLLVGAVYARFLLRLPRRTTAFMVLAGGVFLTGALGCELLGGWYFERIDEEKNLTYVAITTVEELLEMIGVIIFIFSLLDFIRTAGGLDIRIAPGLAAQTTTTQPESAADPQSPPHRPR